MRQTSKFWNNKESLTLPRLYPCQIPILTMDINALNWIPSYFSKTYYIWAMARHQLFMVLWFTIFSQMFSVIDHIKPSLLCLCNFICLTTCLISFFSEQIFYPRLPSCKSNGNAGHQQIQVCISFIQSWTNSHNWSRLVTRI